MSKGDMKKKIESEAKSCSRVTCEDLACHDCEYRYDDSDPFKNGERNADGRLYWPTTVCEKYEVKPVEVLKGGDCELKNS